MANYDVYEHDHNILDVYEIIKHSNNFKDNLTYIDDNTFILKGNQNLYTINSIILAS